MLVVTNCLAESSCQRNQTFVVHCGLLTQCCQPRSGQHPNENACSSSTMWRSTSGQWACGGHGFWFRSDSNALMCAFPAALHVNASLCLTFFALALSGRVQLLYPHRHQPLHLHLLRSGQRAGPYDFLPSTGSPPP